MPAITDYDISMLAKAYEVATRSPDPSTQNGAIIRTVDNDFAYACNTIPSPLQKLPERLIRPLKDDFIEHAERRAIFSCARRGLCTSGATMYCPWAPCTPCARAIIDCGISRLVTHAPTYLMTPDRWLDDVRQGINLLHEAGVAYTPVMVAINAPSIMFDGKMFHPGNPTV